MGSTSSKQLEVLFQEHILEKVDDNIYWDSQLIGSPPGYSGNGLRINPYTVTLAKEKGWITVEQGESAQFIDALYWNTHKQKLFFLNGKVKLKFIKDFVTRHEDYSHKKGWYVTTKMGQIISENWSNLPEEIQRKLRKYFNANSNEYIGNHVYRLIANKDGDLEETYVDPQLYRRIRFPEGVTGYYYVPKSSPLTHPMALHTETLHLCEEEFKYHSKSYKKCNNCGFYEKNEYFVFNLCETCAGDFPKELASYTTRATHFFESVSKKGKFSDILLGIELEYELDTATNKLETLFLLHKNLKEHAIFKRDGSLTNGIEICTRPASFEIHTEEFQKMFTDEQLMKRILVKNTCGMHVHIDRRKMSALTLGKLIKFMQAEENKSFLEIIAERNSNNYFKLATGLSVTSFHRTGGSSDRYQALNTTNQQTAEIRIFKTPDTYKAFMKNVEFVSALTDYVQPANSGIKELSTTYFTNFVQEHRGLYKNLHKYLKENANA